jgi:hypothetical protein
MINFDANAIRILAQDIIVSWCPVAFLGRADDMGVHFP